MKLRQEMVDQKLCHPHTRHGPELLVYCNVILADSLPVRCAVISVYEGSSLSCGVPIEKGRIGRNLVKMR